MRAIIIGAGVGGLITALALRAAGIDGVVCEQDDARGARVGINVQPPAVAELDLLASWSGWTPRRCAPANWSTPTGWDTRSSAGAAAWTPASLTRSTAFTAVGCRACCWPRYASV